MVKPAAVFQANLVDRSGGKHGLPATSAKELMEKVPEWPNYIKSITRWDRVEPGTLTLDNTVPLPGPVLQNLVSLGVEPDNIFDSFDPKYAQRLRQHRGERVFYGAVARANGREQVAVVSQQATPAKNDRLEVYSDVKLRAALQIATDDVVEIDVFNRADWLQITK